MLVTSGGICEQSLSGEPETTFLENHKLRLAAAPTRVAIEKGEFGDQVVRRRTPGEARHSSLSAHRAAIHAIATAASGPGHAGMEHLRPEPLTCGAASDFFVVVTATFRLFYVFVLLEVGTRRIVHWNVTAHPTAEWTAQQFRMVLPGDQTHRFVIHESWRPHAELRTRHSREVRPCAALDRASAPGRAGCNSDSHSGRSSSPVPSLATERRDHVRMASASSCG